MRTEKLKEGWVDFHRIHCKEGYIDRWSGDQANNPNNETKSAWNLNSVSDFFRLNDGEWIHWRKFSPYFLFQAAELSEEFTAEEIWNGYIIKETA